MLKNQLLSFVQECAFAEGALDRELVFQKLKMQKGEVGWESSFLAGVPEEMIEKKSEVNRSW